MTAIGQVEKRTQARVVRLFRETLDYAYLGDDGRGSTPPLRRKRGAFPPRWTLLSCWTVTTRKTWPGPRLNATVA